MSTARLDCIHEKDYFGQNFKETVETVSLQRVTCARRSIGLYPLKRYLRPIHAKTDKPYSLNWLIFKG